MEVDPPKDENADKKESANGDAATAPNPDETPKCKNHALKKYD